MPRAQLLYVCGMSIEAIKRAARIAGSQANLARLLDRDPSTVACWAHRDGGRVPAVHVIALCARLGWQITPHELRPDLYPHQDDGLPDHLRCGAA